MFGRVLLGSARARPARTRHHFPKVTRIATVVCRIARTFGRMDRQRCPHLPRATFRLTARCQGREAHFTPELGTRFVALLERLTFRPDLYVIARAVPSG